MALIVAGPLLGAGFGRVLTSLRETVKDVVRNVRQFKRILKRLDSTLDLLAQAVEDIERSNQQRGRAVENTQSLIEEMSKSMELVRNSLQIPWWNLVLIVKYSSKLFKLEEDILRFCQVDLQLHGARTVLETREIVSGIRESMDSTRSMETPRVSCAVREPPILQLGLICQWRSWRRYCWRRRCSCFYWLLLEDVGKPHWWKCFVRIKKLRVLPSLWLSQSHSIFVFV